MNDLSASAEAHLRQLALLQERLSRHGAAILEHRCLLLLMGSFSLVVGTAHQRMRFTWDGREFFLNVETARCDGLASTPTWVQADNVRIAPPRSVWPVIREHCGWLP